MGFTGLLGTEESQLGNIVLGIVDSFGLVPFGVRPFQSGSRQLVVVFDRPVTDSALNPSSYALTPYTVVSGQFQSFRDDKAFNSTVEFVAGQSGTFTSGPQNGQMFTIASVQDGIYTIMGGLSLDSTSPVTYTTNLPYPVGVVWEDEQHRSVRVTYGADFEFKTYTLTVTNVGGYDGRVADPTPRTIALSNAFTATAMTARLSKNGSIDIGFDLPVGPYSNSSTWSLRTLEGNAASLTVVAWATTGLPPNFIRVNVGSPGLPSSAGFTLSYTSVRDVSNRVNSISGIPLKLETRTTGPYSFPTVQAIQITSASLLDVWPGQKISVARVYFSGWVSAASATNTANWTITQRCGHAVADTGNAMSAAAATDLNSLIALVSDLRTKVYAHIVKRNVHYAAPHKVVVPSSGITNLDTAVSSLNSLRVVYDAHVASNHHHEFSDLANRASSPEASDLASAILLANEMRTNYSFHRTDSRTVPFTTKITHPRFPVNNHASSTNFVQNSFGPSYFCDLYLDGILGAQPIQVQCTIQSEDSATTTSSSAVSGKIVLTQPSSEFIQNEVKRGEYWNRSGSAPQIISAPQSDGRTLSFSSTNEYTNDMFVYLVTKLYVAFSLHISAANGAGHVALDNSHTLPNSFIPELWDPVQIRMDLNDFYTNYLHPHVTSPTYHTSVVEYSAPEDVLGMFRELQIHNESGSGSKNGLQGVHTVPGPSHGSLPSPNLRAMKIDQPSDGLSITFSGQTARGYSYNSLMRSVIQGPGVLYNLEGVGLRELDSLILLFTHPMIRTAITNDSFSVTNGVTVVRAEWTSDRSIELVVSGLTTGSHTVNIFSLLSRAGYTVT